MKKRVNIWLIEIPRITLMVFIILQLISIITYPGSTFFDHHSIGYSLTRNFLSDLGRTECFTGEINYFSSIIFNISIFLSGLVFVMFYINVRNIFATGTPPFAEFFQSPQERRRARVLLALRDSFFPLRLDSGLRE